MKRILVIAISAMFVLSLAATAFAADVVFSGDARSRGIWKNNYDFDNSVDTAGLDSRYYDQRVRLKATVKAGDGVEVRTRLVLLDNKWDGGSGGNTVTSDYAYIHVPIGSINIDVGRQLASWGNKFMAWAIKKDRLKVTSKVNGTVVGGFIDKNAEANAPDYTGDYNGYGALVIHNFGDLKGGIIVIYADDDATGLTGVMSSVFTKGKVGDFGLAAEVAYLAGDKFEDAAGNSPWGGFVHLSKNVDALTFGGAVAYATNGYTANKFFAPTVFFGTSQPTAIMNFGAASDASTFAVVGSVGYKATDALSLIGRVAYASLQDMGVGGADGSAFELDAGLKYAITKNTAYTVDFGALMPNDMSAQDDTAIALAHKVEVKF